MTSLKSQVVQERRGGRRGDNGTINDTAKPASPAFMDPLPKTAKKAARVTTEYPMNSKRMASL